MPTLLSLFEIPCPETVEGTDLFNSKPKDLLFGEISEGPKATRMATDGRYKLIYYPYGNVKEFFDMEEDPFEHKDLSKDPAYSGILEKLEKYMISKLHGDDDLTWVKDGKLVGYPEDHRQLPFTYDLINQRGIHWPLPDEYKSR